MDINMEKECPEICLGFIQEILRCEEYPKKIKLKISLRAIRGSAQIWLHHYGTYINWSRQRNTPERWFYLSAENVLLWKLRSTKIPFGGKAVFPAWIKISYA